MALVAGVSVLAASCPRAVIAAPGVERHAVDATGSTTTTGPCREAKKRLAKLKRGAAKLKRIDAPSEAIRTAQRKVVGARRKAEKACADKDVLFDVTGLSAKFDATYTRDPDPQSSCTFRKDAHWTATLAPGAGPARLQVYYRDKQGRPVYSFGSDGGIPWKAQGSGVATLTCNDPPPAPNGTVSCNFQAERTGSVVVEGDPEGSREQMTLDWYYNFPSFQYDEPGNGGGCASSGPSPPTLNLGERSASLFVSPSNVGDAANALEPPGFSTIPTASLGDTPLVFAGSSSASFGGQLAASWDMSVTLRRR